MTFGHHQVGNPLNGIFLLNITDHYPILYFIIAPINHSGQNLAELKINFRNNLFVINNNCCHIKEKEIYFTRLRKPWISDAIMVWLNELFQQYKNGIVTVDHYNFFKNNFTTTLHHAINNYFQRKFAE